MRETDSPTVPVQPQPGRILDGPLLVFDLPVLMDELLNGNSWLKGQRNSVVLLKSETMRLVLIALRGGDDIDFRQSENLVCLQMLKGSLEFHAEQKTVMLSQGQILTLHETIPHSLIACSETIFLLTISNRLQEDM